MDIKRNKKKYSEKIFNELVLIYLLSNNSYFFEYEADFILKISKRTLKRYIDEINATHVLGKHYSGLESINKNGYKSYHLSKDFFNEEDDPYETALNDNPILLSLGFQQRHPSGLDSDNQHIVRLTRCALLLHKAKCAIKNDMCIYDSSSNRCEKDLHFTENSVVECYDYYFNKMKFNLSYKTFKRDMVIVRDVIEFLNSK